MTDPSNQGPYAPEHSVPTPPSLQSNRSFIVVLIILAVVILFRENIFKTLGWGGSENVELKEQLANLQDKLDELNTAKQLRTQEQVINETKLDEIHSRAKQAISAVDELQSQSDKWFGSLLGLESSDLGKRLAGDSQLVETYLAFVKQSSVDRELPIILRNRIDKLVQPLNEATLSGTFVAPNPALLSEVETVRRQATEAAEDLRSKNNQIESIFRRAPSGSTSQSLAEAVAEVQSRWNEQEAEQVKIAVQKAREEGFQKIANAQAEIQKAKDMEESERIRQEAKRQELAVEKNKLDFDAATEMQRVKDREAFENEKQLAAQLDSKLDQKLAHDAALAEFEKDLTDINTYLPCVTTPAMTQLRGGHFEPASESQPVSFSALKATGGLENDIKGLIKLSYIIEYANRDRPITVPKDANQYGIPGGDKHAIEAVKKVQQLIVKHSAILIEKGMLKE